MGEEEKAARGFKKRKKMSAASYSRLRRKQLSTYKLLTDTMPACKKELSGVIQGHKNAISWWKASGTMGLRRIRGITFTSV